MQIICIIWNNTAQFEKPFRTMFSYFESNLMNERKYKYSPTVTSKRQNSFIISEVINHKRWVNQFDVKLCFLKKRIWNVEMPI